MAGRADLLLFMTALAQFLPPALGEIFFTLVGNDDRPFMTSWCGT